MNTVPRICGLGDNVVDRYPDLGLEFPGGSACNVAVHAVRSGGVASYLGLVGTDASARTLLASLAAEGVDTSRVRAIDGPNSFATIGLDPDGNRQFLEWVPLPDRIELGEDDRRLLAGCDLVHTGHASFTEALLPELSVLTRVSFDFSYKDLAYAAPLLPHLWLAMFSGAELSAEEAVDLARSVQQGGPRRVVVTRGAAGAVVVDGSVVLQQPAVPTVVIDSLGAGDAFIARVLTGLLRDEPLATAAAAAARAAARVCTNYGAFGHAAPLSADRRVS